MNLKTRLFPLVATILCAIAFIFSSTTASAQDAAVVGTLQFKPGCTVLVNGVRRPNGYQIKAGDVVRTRSTCKAQINLTDGGKLVIRESSRVRVYFESNSVVASVLIGGVDYIPGRPVGPNELPVVVGEPSDGGEPLPFLAAFGFGNFSFPSIGGGSASNARLPITNARGQVVGYAVTDGSGKVVFFTDPAGNVLAVGAPNGTPVSGVFGPGTTL